MFLDNIEGARWVTVGLAVKLAQSVSFWVSDFQIQLKEPHRC